MAKLIVYKMCLNRKPEADLTPEMMNFWSFKHGNIKWMWPAILCGLWDPKYNPSISRCKANKQIHRRVLRLQLKQKLLLRGGIISSVFSLPSTFYCHYLDNPEVVFMHLWVVLGMLNDQCLHRIHEQKVQIAITFLYLFIFGKFTGYTTY